MELLVKYYENNIINLTHICLIYGGDGQKEYYIKHYCEHNNIKFNSNPKDAEAGIYCTMIDINNYLVYEKIPDALIKNLYSLIYIQRSTDSPFHKIE